MAKIEIVTKDDLEALKVELIKEFKVLFGAKSSDTKWLRSNEVANLLGISTGTLKNLRDTGQIPFSKLGGTLFYSMDDINQIILANKVICTDER